MKKTTCSIAECKRPHRAKGWCEMHYRRWREHGSTDKPKGSSVRLPRPPRTPEEFSRAFWLKVSKTESCWNWTGTVELPGYGVIKRDGKQLKAHRVSWGLINSELTPSQRLDHVCHNKLCVNPDHLRIVTAKQNAEHRLGANRNSTTGVRGVHTSDRGDYKAVVIHNGKRILAGRFKTITEAEAAVVEMRLKVFTHNNADR